MKLASLVFGTVVLLAAVGIAAPAAAQVQDVAREDFERMTRSLESASSLSLQAFVAYDVVQPTGQKLQFHASTSVQLIRPGKLHAVSLREATEREFWLRDGRLTLLDRKDNSYGSIDGPETVDGMLDFVSEKYGVAMPLADLLYSDIQEAMLDSALSGTLVGTTTVEGVPCRHLAFQHPAVDWQIWIETSDRALPRKLVITYKREPGAPQYTASLWDWSLDPVLPTSLFEFTPPEGAEETEVLPLAVPGPPQRPGSR